MTDVGKITKPSTGDSNLISSKDRDVLSKILSQLQHETLTEQFKSIVSVEGRDWNVKRVSNGILFTMAGAPEEEDLEDLDEDDEEEGDEEDSDEEASDEELSDANQ